MLSPRKDVLTAKVAEFVKLLQDAHAGELAAYHAYDGHWKSVKDPNEARFIKAIQADEKKHVSALKDMLQEFYEKPNRLRDLIFIIIGKTASFMCYFTGWYAPMWGAAFIERIGTTNYLRMAALASELHHSEFYDALMDMARCEQRHEDYFRQLLK